MKRYILELENGEIRSVTGVMTLADAIAKVAPQKVVSGVAQDETPKHLRLEAYGSKPGRAFLNKLAARAEVDLNWEYDSGHTTRLLYFVGDHDGMPARAAANYLAHLIAKNEGYETAEIVYTERNA